MVLGVRFIECVGCAVSITRIYCGTLTTYVAPIVLVTFNACSPTLLSGFYLSYTRSDSNQSEWLDLNQHLLTQFLTDKDLHLT